MIFRAEITIPPSNTGPKRACSVEGCVSQVGLHGAKGLCSLHYKRLSARGSTDKWVATKEKLEWLLAHVGFNGSGCLTWPFFRDKGGYGALIFEGKTTTAHRVMLTLTKGAPQDQKLHAAHSCGNGAMGCVNPRHLRWATPASNNADKIAHGTSNRGERHGNSKLRWEHVQQIREQISRGDVQRRIAERFGVNPSTITAIKNRSTWWWLV